jgi:histidine phosphotransferase ChpT
MPDPLQLSEIVCARLCHDLSGLVGSVLAALELVDGTEAADEALTVASESAVILGHRLRFIRAAWAGDGGAMGVSEVQTLANNVGTAQRLQLEFTGFDPAGMLGPAEARVLLNLLLLAMEGTAGGGRITVSRAGSAEIVVAIDGPRAAWPSGLAACLGDEKAAWNALTDARSLQAPLTALLARRAGLRLSLLIPAAIGAGAPPPLLLAPVPIG